MLDRRRHLRQAGVSAFARDTIMSVWQDALDRSYTRCPPLSSFPFDKLSHAMITTATNESVSTAERTTFRDDVHGYVKHAQALRTPECPLNQSVTEHGAKTRTPREDSCLKWLGFPLDNNGNYRAGLPDDANVRKLPKSTTTMSEEVLDLSNRQRQPNAAQNLPSLSDHRHNIQRTPPSVRLRGGGPSLESVRFSNQVCARLSNALAVGDGRVLNPQTYTEQAQRSSSFGL